MKNKIPYLTNKNISEEKLFNGIWICWDKLTFAEKAICIYIILFPIWWVLGWGYMWLLIATGILTGLKVRGKEINLKRPSPLIVFGFIFYIYAGLSTCTRSSTLSPSTLIGLSMSFFFMFILWYIESNNIRIRVRVLAWALSVLALECLLFWVVIQLILNTPYFIPPRSIIASFLDKSERYIAGAGNSNYLLPYWPKDKLPGGLVRFGFFFPTPENFSLIAAAISLVSLELKNRYWKISLFSSGIFLLFLSGTRSSWISLFIVLIAYYAFISGKRFGISILLALIACFSFVSLSLPSITDQVFEDYNRIQESAGNLRRDSTEVRSLIYKRTWEAIVSEPDNLLLGRGVEGATVLPGYEPAKVGTHSFILGNLFYRQGLVGSLLFLSYWLSIAMHLYQTRAIKPSYVLPMLLLASITFVTMEICPGHNQIILLTLLSAKQKEKSILSADPKAILESYNSRYGFF
jgi:hypothetical protein